MTLTDPTDSTDTALASPAPPAAAPPAPARPAAAPPAGSAGPGRHPTGPTPATGEVLRAPTLRRRLHIELRKLLDTVTGQVLTGITIVAAPLLIVLWTALEDTAGVTLEAAGGGPVMTIDLVVGAGSMAAAFLLPVLTATVITSEWGQGSIVTTFAMDHARGRVLTAKVLAGLVFGLVVALTCVGVSLLTAVVAGIDLGATDQVVRTCLGVTAALLVYALLGSAWGALTLNTPLAIVVAIAGPQVINTVVVLLGERLADVGPWIQFSYAVGDLTQGTVADWGHLLSVIGLWVVLPLALGAWRIRRADIS